MTEELSFWDKARGVEGAKPPPTADAAFIAKSGLGGAASIGVLSLVHFYITDASDLTLVLGSFGASAVLLFGAPAAPFSQPRNVIGGHTISALMGISASQLISVGMGVPALAAPLGVAAAIMAMQATNTVHPPAGGTALIAILGSPAVVGLGYGLVVPALGGSTLLVASAVLYNNACRGSMRYPQYWW